MINISKDILYDKEETKLIKQKLDQAKIDGYINDHFIVYSIFIISEYGEVTIEKRDRFFLVKRHNVNLSLNPNFTYTKLDTTLDAALEIVSPKYRRHKKLKKILQ